MSHSIIANLVIGDGPDASINLTLIGVDGDTINTTIRPDWAESNGDDNWLAELIRFEINRRFNMPPTCHGWRKVYESPRNTVERDGGLASIRLRGIMVTFEFDYDEQV